MLCNRFHFLAACSNVVLLTVISIAKSTNITWDADDRYIAFYDQDGQIKILCNFNFRVLSFISGPGTKWTGYEILIKTMDGMDFNVKMEVNIEWDISNEVL